MLCFRTAVYAVKALHENGILHRDISSNNMLLYALGGLLIDFDYALDLWKRLEALSGPRGVRTVS